MYYLWCHHSDPSVKMDMLKKVPCNMAYHIRLLYSDMYYYSSTSWLRIVFRSYIHVRKMICTSVSQWASTRVSHCFNLRRHKILSQKLIIIDAATYAWYHSTSLCASASPWAHSLTCKSDSASSTTPPPVLLLPYQLPLLLLQQLPLDKVSPFCCNTFHFTPILSIYTQNPVILS